SFDEVKSQASAGWQKQERGRKLSELATSAAPKFAEAATRGAVLQEYNLKPTATATIKKSSRAAGELVLPAELVSDAFTRKLQQGTGVYVGKNSDYLIAVIDNVIPAASSDTDAKLRTSLNEIRQNMESTEQNEIYEQYTHYLLTKYSVSVNDNV